MIFDSLMFSSEENVIRTARDFLNRHPFADPLAREHMAVLLNEYEKLFRQTMRIVKMGDRMQSRLSTLNETLRCKQEELCYLATTDVLTGLCNRRSFMELAQQELERSGRHNLSLSLLLLDVDRFKLVNDRFGHQAGDMVLKHIAETGRSTLRKIDVFARFGGEEFVVLLPETGLEGAAVVAERLRMNMADYKILVGDRMLSYTASIGVASCRGTALPDLGALIKAADEALYASKNKGRNMVTCSPAGVPE
jgi:diguanylate cyclase (GGDEF)-like protein